MMKGRYVWWVSNQAAPNLSPVAELFGVTLRNICQQLTTLVIRKKFIEQLNRAKLLE
jgi:hypothetical protein